ncbi:Hypothetical predicted protein [Octopus vulgaris]|uniref:Uncharacterized protein n=1 Tax=Octopus vulgaris TaxID=6645 RepID=A0AA36AGP1_OCTVU|nr:Hypothetical predicted protein [Octopus vulgaris]
MHEWNTISTVWWTGQKKVMEPGVRNQSNAIHTVLFITIFEYFSIFRQNRKEDIHNSEEKILEYSHISSGKFHCHYESVSFKLASYLNKISQKRISQEKLQIVNKTRVVRSLKMGIITSSGDEKSKS